MRTYNVTFSESNTGNKFNYKANKEGFRRMRRFILRAKNGMNPIFMSHLVDVCDDIKEMKVGETLFVVSPAYEPYVEKNIKELNRVIAMMDEMARENDMPEYMANEFTAFMVKRTPAMWKFATLSTVD